MKNSYIGIFGLLLLFALSSLPFYANSSEKSFESWSVVRSSSFDRKLLASAQVFSADGSELFVGCRYSPGRLSAFLGLPDKDRTLSDRGVSNIAFRMDNDLIQVEGFSSTNGERYHEVTFLPPEVLAKLLSLTNSNFDVKLQDSRKVALFEINFDVRGAAVAISEVRSACGLSPSPSN